MASNLGGLIRTPLLDLRGSITRPWILFFERLAPGPPRLSGNLADIPANLTKADKGTIFEAVDFNHVYQWDGSAWKWAPGEMGSDFIMGFRAAPTGVGWQLCNGATVTYAKEDGTTANVTVPNLTASAAYLKLGASLSGPNAAIAPTGTIGAASGSELVDTGANSAAADGHTHSLSMNTDGEPPHLQLIPYYRR